jgi:hypothetical protein
MKLDTTTHEFIIPRANSMKIEYTYMFLMIDELKKLPTNSETTIRMAPSLQPNL